MVFVDIYTLSDFWASGPNLSIKSIIIIINNHWRAHAQHNFVFRFSNFMRPQTCTHEPSKCREFKGYPCHSAEAVTVCCACLVSVC